MKPDGASASPASIIRNLDQVEVGIANIDRLDRADRTGARPWSGYDRNAAAFEMRRHFGERYRRDKAQIGRTRGRSVAYQTRNVVGGMQVDLLLTKAQRGAAFAKANDLHAQHPGIKFAGTLDVRDRQNQVIKPFDVHLWSPPLPG